MLDALGDHPKRERRDRARTEAMAPLQLGGGLGDPLWITQIRRRGALASRSLGLPPVRAIKRGAILHGDSSPITRRIPFRQRRSTSGGACSQICEAPVVNSRFRPSDDGPMCLLRPLTPPTGKTIFVGVFRSQLALVCGQESKSHPYIG
jgi:hypothetical protein